jgi:FXSXX-COOH protein
VDPDAVPRPSLLADVSMTELAELFDSDDSVLAVALRRVVDSAEQSAQTISGWSSYVDVPDPDP